MGDSRKVLDRIAKLMALAAGEGEEARTAAHMAVKLMLAERVQLSLPSDVHGAPRTRPPAGFEDLDDLFRAMRYSPPWERRPTDFYEPATEPAPASVPVPASDPFDFDAAMRKDTR